MTFEFNPDDLRQVLTPAATIAVVAFLAAKLTVKGNVRVLAVVLVKTAVFLYCYAMFFDGFTPNQRPDDTVYMKQGLSLLRQLETKPWDQISLIYTAESFHFFYIVPVALAIHLFGVHYFSLVALNVIVSLLAGCFAFAIIKKSYKNERIASWFFVAIVLHPDVLTWTNTFAGKDTWVLLGHLIFIYGFVCLAERDRKAGFAWLLMATLLTLNLRFYIPVIMMGLVLLYSSRAAKFWLTVAILGILATTPETVSALQSLLRGGVSSTSIDLLSLLVGIPRFWLSPRPFFEDELHRVLRFATIVNWMIFPVMLTGMYRSLVSGDRLSRFILVYFLVFSVLYGFTAFLNGPRHRLQLVFAQVFFVWVGLSYFRIISPRLRLLGPRLRASLNLQLGEGRH